jgi:non-ribosomal peptide synthetase component F
MTLLAAFQALLARLAGETDVVVGTPIANRNRAEIEELIGFFVNTLACASISRAIRASASCSRGSREAALGAFAHQDLPFERIVEALAPQRDLSRSPIFQVFFNLLDFGTDALELPELAASGVDGDEKAGSKFDLTLYAEDAPEGLHLQMVYATDLFDGPRVEEMLVQLGQLLARFAADRRRASEAPRCSRLPSAPRCPTLRSHCARAARLDSRALRRARAARARADRR